MTVILNGEARDVLPGTTVADVVTLLDRGQRGVAVAVNEEVVPRAQWPHTALHDRDHIEVLTAAAGG